MQILMKILQVLFDYIVVPVLTECNPPQATVL